jgi:hypothetical protein
MALIRAIFAMTIHDVFRRRISTAPPELTDYEVSLHTDFFGAFGTEEALALLQRSKPTWNMAMCA